MWVLNGELFSSLFGLLFFSLNCLTHLPRNSHPSILRVIHEILLISNANSVLSVKQVVLIRFD